MASRTLRIRTVEPSQQEDIFTSQGECDWPHDQPEQLDEVETEETTQLSPTEVNEMAVTEAQMIPTNTMTRSKIYSGNTNADDQSELKTMLASVLAKLEISHRELENKLETSFRENNDKFQRDIEIKLEKLQENMKTSQNRN
jgi:predicted FMN-binding regulatory protein PaiB